MGEIPRMGSMSEEITSARIDVWLWSVRIFKTRALAADECKGGHVRVNDASAKPSQKLKRGDIVRVRYPGWERVFKVENSSPNGWARRSPSPVTKTSRSRAPRTCRCRRSPNANAAPGDPPRKNAVP